MLERDYVLLYGPKIRIEEGVKHRNKILQPCGCWAAEVWREVELRGVKRKGWCPETRQCKVHSAAAAVLQLQIGQRIENALSNRQQQLRAESEKHVSERYGLDPERALKPVVASNLGDGAKRLLADSERILAAADALNRELKALEAAGPVPVKKLTDGRSRNKKP